MAEKLTPSWSSGRRKGKPGRRVKPKPWFSEDTQKALDSAMDILIYLIYFGLLILFLRVLAALADSICGCANLWRLLEGGAQMVVGSPFLTLPRPQALVGPWPGDLETSLRWARGTRLILADKDSEAVITGYTGTVAAYICRLGVPSGNTHKQLALSSLPPVVVTPSQVYEGTVSKVKPTKTLPLEVPLPHVNSSGMDLEAPWLLRVRPGGGGCVACDPASRDDAGGQGDGERQETPWPEGVAKGEILNRDNVRDIYVKLLGRDPDPQGHDYWANSGITTDALVAELGKHVQPATGHGDHNQTAGGHEDGETHQPERQGIPRDQVEGFVGNWIGGKDHYRGTKVMWAEKLHDYVDKDNFVYEVGLDNGRVLYFDKNTTFLHSAHENEFADHEVEELKTEEIPSDVKDAIEGSHPGAKIIEVEKEFSLEPPAEGEEKDFIYLAVIEKNGEELEVALGKDGKVYHTHQHDRPDFEEWEAVELPTMAVDHLREKYKDDGDEVHYSVEERLRPDGIKEFVARLDDDREIFFDANGSFVTERDPWKERIQKLALPAEERVR